MRAPLREALCPLASPLRRPGGAPWDLGTWPSRTFCSAPGARARRRCVGQRATGAGQRTPRKLRKCRRQRGNTAAWCARRLDTQDTDDQRHHQGRELPSSPEKG
ncbi:hypothetical protein PsYK624_062810 [Phanerochaete sordida]|uniref:Uncharacterized protein n=1 Tax=Phanerochaete sordida TaxID=48140 RepID=A0A9P3G8B7_9APHY|nr:hypothetical protein PsYK624_062810 [Phanerochaete sordida]